jgi:hypothetical protein
LPVDEQPIQPTVVDRLLRSVRANSALAPYLASDLCRDRVGTSNLDNNLDGYRGLPNTSKYVVAEPPIGLGVGLGISRPLTFPFHQPLQCSLEGAPK